MDMIEMTPETIKNGVLLEISELSGKRLAKINLNDDLQKDLGMDSLDCIELILGLEERFNVDLDNITGTLEVELPKGKGKKEMNTVQDVISVICLFKDLDAPEIVSHKNVKTQGFFGRLFSR